MKVTANIPKNPQQLGENVTQQFGSSNKIVISLVVGCILAILIVACTIIGVVGWAIMVKKDFDSKPKQVYIPNNSIETYINHYTY